MIKWSLKESTSPTIEPISIEDAKLYLRIDWDYDDLFIAGLIVAARHHCEDYQRRAYMTRDYTLYIDQFPGISGEIFLPKPPLQSVTSVKYTDNEGVQRTYDPSNYNIDATYEPGRLVLGWGKTWPVTTLRTSRAIEIAYVAGYGDETATPQVVKQAMMFLIGHWYDNRTLMIDKRSTELPMTVQSLLYSNRIFPMNPTGGLDNE